MSYNSYNQYGRMTTEEKDRCCDSNVQLIADKIRQHEVREGEIIFDLSQNKLVNVNNSKHSLKRQLTSTSYIGDINTNEEDDNEQFILVKTYNKHKQRRHDENNEDENNEEYISIIDQNSAATSERNVTNGRIFLNSKNKTNINGNNNENSYVSSSQHTIQRHAQEDKNKNKNKQNDTSNGDNRNVNRMTGIQRIDLTNGINENCKNIKSNDFTYFDTPISQHALLYAVENHLPPIKISCQSKINQNHQGKEIIKSLFTCIEKGFRQINKGYKLPLGFDYWYVDKNGDLVCFTKHTELFVYLSEPQNYPSQISNVNITPSRPRHLPTQHSVVLKFVPNYITQDEIECEIKSSFTSIFNIEEMRGSMTDKSRHVRLELSSPTEYNSIIKNAGITINGHLIGASEFLSPPRLLICSKCNDPGHIRRNCNFQYDACRRCGKDRTLGDHKECKICCHRCNENHLSTDYKCPYLVDYRRSLLYKLKDQPNLLPPNINIFIPTECREKGVKNNKVLSNPLVKLNNTATNNSNALPFNLSSHTWQSISKIAEADNTTYLNEQTIWNDLKTKQDEINKVKDELNIKMQQLQAKYDDHMKKMNSILLIVSHQVKNQNESVERCYTTINEVLPILSSTLEVFQRLITQSGMFNNKDNISSENQSVLNHISQSLDFIKDRNDLLSSNQQILDSLVEQQNALMIQEINSLLTNK